MPAVRPKTIAYLGHIWPEPQSSAAGIRALGLIAAFQAADWRVHFLSPDAGPDPRELEGAQTARVAPNDPAFDELIARIRPDVVLFDRFHVEERYGWRVARVLPEAARVLDTVDLHGLREARQ